MFGVGVTSNIPGEDGRKIAEAMKEELDSIEASMKAVQGMEFTSFVLPMATLISNIGQLISIASSSGLTPEKRAFLSVTIDAFTHQVMEIVMHRGIAFVENNPDHKTIKDLGDFISAYQRNSAMILDKIREYMEGKQV